MTIIDKSKHQAERFPKRTIVPEPAHFRMRCGVCATMDFEVHTSDKGQIVGVICLGCLKVRRVDPNGFIQSDGKVTITKPGDDYVTQLPNTIRAQHMRKANG